MMKRILLPLSILSVLTLFSCNKTAKSSLTEEEAYQKFKNSSNDGKTFGEKVTAKGAVSYDDILPKIKALKGADKIENVKIAGTVEAVCKAKGCWMNIQSQKGDKPMFVKFKDYAFFMPKDIVGKKVVMQGYAFKEVTDIETLRHFAADEGKSKEEIAKISQAKEEYKFMANGVLILN